MVPQVGDVYEITVDRGPFAPYRNRKGETITVIYVDKRDIRWDVSWWDKNDDYEFDYYDSISPEAFVWFYDELKLVQIKRDPLWEL